MEEKGNEEKKMEDGVDLPADITGARKVSGLNCSCKENLLNKNRILLLSNIEIGPYETEIVSLAQK